MVKSAILYLGMALLRLRRSDEGGNSDPRGPKRQAHI
jgi:hypothetical protein